MTGRALSLFIDGRQTHRSITQRPSAAFKATQAHWWTRWVLLDRIGYWLHGNTGGVIFFVCSNWLSHCISHTPDTHTCIWTHNSSTIEPSVVVLLFLQLKLTTNLFLLILSSIASNLDVTLHNGSHLHSSLFLPHCFSLPTCYFQTCPTGWTHLKKDPVPMLFLNSLFFRALYLSPIKK